MSTRRCYFTTPLLREAVGFLKRSSGRRQYEIAKEVGFDRSKLSHILIGAVGVRDDDPRVLRLVEKVGLSFDEAFQQFQSDDQRLQSLESHHG